QFLRDTGGRDIRLAVGGDAATPFLPVAFASIVAVPRSPLAALLAARHAASSASAPSTTASAVQISSGSNP
ncbi:MAG: hypothetical protein ABI205_11485, partial [Gemmatimonadaceae bacterium]